MQDPVPQPLFLASNPVLRGQSTATNRLSHGAEGIRIILVVARGTVSCYLMSHSLQQQHARHANLKVGLTILPSVSKATTGGDDDEVLLNTANTMTNVTGSVSTQDVGMS